MAAIGLGDIAPQTQAGRAYGIVHMLLSVILFTSILSTILSSLDRRVQVRSSYLPPSLPPYLPTSHAPRPSPHASVPNRRCPITALLGRSHARRRRCASPSTSS
jgi:hypothetical protein